MCPEFEDCQKQLDLRILNPISFEFSLTRRSIMRRFLPAICEKQSAMVRFLPAIFGGKNLLYPELRFACSRLSGLDALRRQSVHKIILHEV
jgi:hypothetical protein